MIVPGRPVKDIEIDSNTSIEKIFDELSKSGGFESVNLSNGLEILTEMISDKQCLRFISCVASVMSTGLRGIIKDMIKNKWFDVVMTTCGALDHDIARHFSHYNEGSFTMDDKELADKIVACGVGKIVGYDDRGQERVVLYRVDREVGTPPEKFVRDWR
ncbi:MAG: deoxyhypusine synthase family protein, partial [Nitrosopumilus sp.]